MAVFLLSIGFCSKLRALLTEVITPVETGQIGCAARKAVFLNTNGGFQLPSKLPGTFWPRAVAKPATPETQSPVRFAQTAPASAKPAEERSPYGSGALIIGLAALSAVNYFDRSILAIAAPRLMRQFRLSEVAMGTAFSAFLLSYTILLTPGGWLADRVGARRVLSWACAAWAIFTAATALAGSQAVRLLPPFAALIGIRFVLGVASAPLYPASAKVVATAVEPRRVTAVQGLVVCCAGVGSAAAPFLFSRLIDLFDWRFAFCAAAALTGLVAAAWAAVARHPAGVQAARPTGAAQGFQRAVLRNRSLLWLSASYFSLNYFEYIFFYWIYYYFGQIRNFTASLAAAASTATMFGMIVLGPAGGWIADVLARRFGLMSGRRYVAITGMLLSAVLLYLGAAGFSPVLTITLLAFAFGCASAAEGPFWATAAAAGSEYAGSAGGFMNTVGNLGGMIAPVLTPLIAARFGWTSALWVASGVVLLGVLAWAGVRDNEAAA
jgi:MFS family permease